MINGTVLAQNGKGSWLRFSEPSRVIAATRNEDVLEALADAQQAVDEGQCVAGFISYEAASALDEALSVHPPLSSGTSLPLVWLGVYCKAETLAALPCPHGVEEPARDAWVCDTDAQSYAHAMTRIKDYIAAGDTYQVNYTVRFRQPFQGDPYALFFRLSQAQQSQCCVFIDTESFAICSASPELFFEREGNCIRAKPMKGTAPRALTSTEDRQVADALRHCPKNRAENVMIVDMIRNDLGRVAFPGSVVPRELFAIEPYPTVHQMVSTVEALTAADLRDTFAALFPCASVTGAPKVRTMQIIRELESSPRGVYTGSCGYWLGHDEARFNVAIRTVQIDKTSGSAQYGAGGGVVWDSTVEGEYNECLAKTAILNYAPRPSFQLLESLLYDSSSGWLLLDEHIQRAKLSAGYFGYSFSESAMRSALETCVRDQQCHTMGSWKVRWLLSRDGTMSTEAIVLEEEHACGWKVGLAMDAVRSDDVFLYHKTTHRQAYDAALLRFPACRDVILVNEQGCVTESCFGNVVLEVGSKKITPPVSCGLLNGVFRQHLLNNGSLYEQKVTPDMLEAADRVWLINSVRQWIPVQKEMEKGLL